MPRDFGFQIIFKIRIEGFEANKVAVKIG